VSQTFGPMVFTGSGPLCKSASRTTTTARDSMWGPTFPELVEGLPGIEIIDRSSVNAFDDARVARSIEGTGRKKLIFAGISLEVCAAFPAITAVGKGLDAYVAVDASGTFSETKRQAGILRMLQAGVILSDYATLMVDILKDNARPEAGAVRATPVFAAVRFAFSIQTAQSKGSFRLMKQNETMTDAMICYTRGLRNGV
jgi:hypothetical protein